MRPNATISSKDLGRVCEVHTESLEYTWVPRSPWSPQRVQVIRAESMSSQLSLQKTPGLVPLNNVLFGRTGPVQLRFIWLD